MKRLILLILPLLAVIFVSQRIFVSECDQPISYRIDTVDSKFNLSNEKFVEYSKKAADIWNKAYEKDLLVFNPHGSLSINLIYDERQLLNSQINSLEGQINIEKDALDPQIEQYKKDVLSFNLRLADLNNQIESWNQKGGAPKNVYDQLIEEQKSLLAEADRLNARGKSLSLTTQNFNAQVGKLNQKLDTFNEAITLRPEEGIYKADQDRIEIYFYITQNELIHTLAHEMGHALGLGHTSSPKSLMYSMTNQVIKPTAEDLAALEAICAKKSVFDTALSKLSN